MATFSNTPRPAYVYEAATDQWIPVGFGPHTHAVTDVTNAFNTTTVTAKGDLVVAAGSNSVTKLPVGANGQILFADSTTTTGLRWQDSQSAGKNYVINGGFDHWQRGTSLTPGGGAYTADRWTVDSAATVVRDAGPSNIPFSYKLSNSAGNPAIRTRLEFSATGNQAPYINGSTWTVSYWAKRSTGTAPANLYAAFLQSGDGSPVQLTNAELGTVTTSWQRFTHTFTISVTANASADRIMLVPYTNSGSFSGDTWFAGVKFEQGNVATPFSRAGGSIGGELALCQRYFSRRSAQSATYAYFGSGEANSSTEAKIFIQYPVEMRGNPTLTPINTTSFAIQMGSVFQGVTSISADMITTWGIGFRVGVSANLVDGRGCRLLSNNSTATALEFSAEL